VSSSVDREWCRSSCGGERHTHRGDQRCKPPSSKRPVPPKLPKARAAALIESVADVAAAASVTPDRAISGADTVQQAARAAQASESESSSVDREWCRSSCGGERHSRHLSAISGADTEQRAAYAAQASESESSSVDRECWRRSRGGERHTRQGDQRGTCRAASGLCRPSFRKREQQR